MSELEKQFNWYLSNQSTLVAQFDGRWVLIHKESVAGDFSTELEAYEDAIKRFTPGEFLIQKVSPGSESYTQTFHSRVII